MDREVEERSHTTESSTETLNVAPPTSNIVPVDESSGMVADFTLPKAQSNSRGDLPQRQISGTDSLPGDRHGGDAGIAMEKYYSLPKAVCDNNDSLLGATGGIPLDDDVEQRRILAAVDRQRSCISQCSGQDDVFQDATEFLDRNKENTIARNLNVSDTDTEKKLSKHMEILVTSDTGFTQRAEQVYNMPEPDIVQSTKSLPREEKLPVVPPRRKKKNKSATPSEDVRV